MNKTVLITGGAGYVGSALVPLLLSSGHRIIVYDLYLYGDIFKNIKNRNLIEIKGDIRDKEKLINASRGADGLIHLACLANDPSFELNPELGKAINYDAFFNILEAAQKNKIKRLIFASSASVYGTQEDEVTEDIRGRPLTDYGKYKLLCEDVLRDWGLKNYVIVRPGSIFGYAPRLRLDLITNNFTIRGLLEKKISFFGGWQLRPHIGIKDIIRVYQLLLEAPEEAVNEKVFNVSLKNVSVKDTAQLVADVLKEKHSLPDVQIEKLDVFDKRSYHLNSEKIKKELGFIPKFTLEEGVTSIADAEKNNLINDGLNNPLYYNVKLMKLINLK